MSMVEGSGHAGTPPNRAAVVGVVAGILFGAEAVLVAQHTHGRLAVSILLAGVVGCWLIYQTARRTRSKVVTALVGIGLTVLLPLALFMLFAATYPADNS